MQRPTRLAPIAALAVALLGVRWTAGAAAAPVPPPGCVDHVSPPGDPEVTGDVRCAGMFVDFHHDGAAASPHPVWAGQWAVLGTDGTTHRGWCINHRGVHPVATRAATPGPVRLPGDPDGRRSAYLTTTYGDTDDPVTSAALWAVFHWYAADAAGTNRSRTPDAPLVPRLDDLSRMTGRADLEARALELAAEAEDAAAISDAPAAVTWRGTPAWSDPQGVQPLLAAGTPPPTTTTTHETTTTTTPPPTSTTTTTIPAATSTTPPTPPPTSTTSPTAAVVTVPPAPEDLPPGPAVPATTLPATGGGVGPAPLGLGLLTAGAGLIGAVRRRTLRR